MPVRDRTNNSMPSTFSNRLICLVKSWLGHKQTMRRTGQLALLGHRGEVAQQPHVDIHADRL